MAGSRSAASLEVGYRILEHTADVGIEAWGADLREAFAAAARGMFSLMIELDRVVERTVRTQRIRADDRQGLLVAWLNELIGLVDAEGEVFRRFLVDELTARTLVARAFGEALDLDRHEPHLAIKAATYHDVSVEAGPPARVRVLLDI